MMLQKKERLQKAKAAPVFAAALLASSIFGCAATQQTADQEPARKVITLNAIKLIALPSQVKSGDGSAENRFEVDLETAKEEKGQGSWKVPYKLTVDFNGQNVFFNVNFSLSQLKNSTREAAGKELKAVLLRAAEHRFNELGHPLQSIELRADIDKALAEYAASLGQLDKGVEKYLEGKK